MTDHNRNFMVHWDIIGLIVLILLIIVTFFFPIFNKERSFAEITINGDDFIISGKIKIYNNVQNVELTEEKIANCKFIASIYEDLGSNDSVQFYITPITEKNIYLQNNGYKAIRVNDIENQYVYSINNFFTLGSNKYPIKTSEKYSYTLKHDERTLSSGSITAKVFTFYNYVNEWSKNFCMIIGFLTSIIGVFKVLKIKKTE